MDLDSVVAEWYLGLYPPEKMPVLALWALEQGFDGPALRELAGRTSATRSDEGDLIERALRELGKEPLDLSGAGRLLAILLCQQIVSGKTSPYEGAARSWSIYDRCGRPKSLIPFVGFASEWEDHELPVDPHCDHRWDFPCCVWSPLPACRRQYPGRSDGICSLVPFH
jgi:hypothetical protein